jgi:plasmid stability protein
MILLTDDLRERLLANGLERSADHVPVVKFFNPLGEGVWLATELDADGSTLFGLADLGYPELGSFSLEELASIVLPFSMGIQRNTREPGSIRARIGGAFAPHYFVICHIEWRPSQSPENAIMLAIILNNLSERLFRVLKFRAAQHNRSVEVEMRAILKAAMHPSGRLQTGKALSTMGRTIGLTNADVETLERDRDTRPAEPIRFE